MVALALVAGCDGGGSTAPRADDEELARVASVRDGDTILLSNGARVRLLQVDAPELVGECYGNEAARTLERLAPRGAPIRLEQDPPLDSVDRHGRLLRYAYVAGRSVGLELVKAGAAAPYFYRGVRGRYAAELERAARTARGSRSGLWGACPAATLLPHRAIATGPATAATTG